MEGWEQFFLILGLAMVGCLVISLVGLFLMVKRIRELRVPPDADFFTTMRFIPLLLAILLDLLDFGLDVLAAPVSWVILDRMGLKGLRNKAAIEAFIPFTGPIPTFVISWFAVRMLNLGISPEEYYAATERIVPNRRRLPDYDDYEDDYQFERRDSGALQRRDTPPRQRRPQSSNKRYER